MATVFSRNTARSKKAQHGQRKPNGHSSSTCSPNSLTTTAMNRVQNQLPQGHTAFIDMTCEDKQTCIKLSCKALAQSYAFFGGDTPWGMYIVPKMEAPNLLRLFWGWGFPYISLAYILHTTYLGEYLHFRYLKCLVTLPPITHTQVQTQAALCFYMCQPQQAA